MLNIAAILMLIDTFLDYLLLERNYSEKTIVNYKKDLEEFKAFFENENDECTWITVDSDMVRRWAVNLMVSPNNCKAVSVNRKLSTLRTFYRFLLSRKVVAINPMRKIRGPKKNKVLPVFVKENQMEEILNDSNFKNDFVGIRNRLIIEMFYETGIRRAELISLNNYDIDLSLKNIKVLGKRNKERLIPFGPELYEEIMKYIDIRNEFFGEISDSFFVNRKGNKMTANDVYIIVKKELSKVVTLKKCSPHVLRHTFATSMLNNQAELVAIKELLGHKSLSTTTIYTNTTFEELKKVYKQAHPRA